MTVTLRCEGCGWTPPTLRERPFAFRCAHQGGDEADHVLAPVLGGDVRWSPSPDAHPFVRYRSLLHAHSAALASGLSDDDYVALVRRLDAKVAAVDGHGMRVTPFVRGPALPECDAPWVKDESVNVSGSHKARHLFGVLLHLEIARAAGFDPSPAPLAIASCGNAALAAAVLARAADRGLDVYVPPDAHPRVVARLGALGARVHTCHRASHGTGDPCVTAFREAVTRGAIPFSCQGSDNGLTLDGGRTLGYELMDAGATLDRVFVQVGGGALASSVARAFEAGVALGVIARAPRFMAVQGVSVAPLAAAYERVMAAIRTREDASWPDDPDERAGFLARRPTAERVLDDLRAHRARYLRPWLTPAPSVAHGILDDEVYDGAAVLRAVLRTGGRVLTVDEATLQEAELYGWGRVDATGTAGLAGLMAWSRERPRAPESRAVLFTGAKR